MCYNRIFRTRHFRATQEFFLRVFAITENYRKVTLTRTPDPLTLSDPRDGVVTLTDPQCGDFFSKLALISMPYFTHSTCFVSEYFVTFLAIFE